MEEEGWIDSKDRLERKLSKLEHDIRELHGNLVGERVKLDGAGEGYELPEDWAALNRLHLPECPLVKSFRYDPNCAVHGKAKDYNNEFGVLSCSELYARKLNEAEQQLKEDISKWSPGASACESPGRVPSNRYEISSIGSGISPGKVYDYLSRHTHEPEEAHPANGLAVKSEAVNGMNVYTNDLEEYYSDSDSNLDRYNPYSAVENAAHEISSIENFVENAYSKMKGKFSQ